MQQKVKEFIVSLLERKQPIPLNIEIDGYQYLDLGHIDSLGVIKFVIQIEEKFDVEISDSDMILDGFRTVGGLVQIINNKVKNNVPKS